MVQCETALSPLITHWSYCNLTLSHRYSVERWIHITGTGARSLHHSLILRYRPRVTPSCHNIQLIRLVIWPNGRWWFLYHLLIRNYVNTSRARKTAKIRALWCGDWRSELLFSVDAMFWWMWVTAITRLRWCTVCSASDITFCVICYCFKLLIAFRFSNLPCLTNWRVGWDQVIIS